MSAPHLRGPSKENEPPNLAAMSLKGHEEQVHRKESNGYHMDGGFRADTPVKMKKAPPSVDTSASEPTRSISTRFIVADGTEIASGGSTFESDGHLKQRYASNPSTALHDIKTDVMAKAEHSDNWSDEPDVPTSKEVGRIVDEQATDYRRQLNPNIVFGPWSSTEEYLKTLYGLFREDGLGPLRDCVDEVRDCPFLEEADSQHKARIYESVYVTGATLCRKGLAFRMEFTTRRSGKRIQWSLSSRLKSGTAVALTPARDAFSTICKIAIVVARPVRDLNIEAPAKPAVHIEFGDPNDIEVDPQQEWLMVEAPNGYWEATRHTLVALQKMRSEGLPLSQHILNLKPKVETPPYANMERMLELAQIADEKLAEKESHGLDRSQREALDRILTKSLAIVQGPPGTGKTYISVVALRLLLTTVRSAEGPIIVTAHTNHALDQLLRHIAVFEPDFVRLGGQSSDQDVIMPRTLPVLREKQKSKKGSRAEPISMEKQAHKDLDPLVAALGMETPLPLALFSKHGLLTDAQCKSLEGLENDWQEAFNGSDDPMSEFCSDQITPFKRRGHDFDPTLWEDFDEASELQVEDSNLTLGLENDKYEELHGRFMIFNAGYTSHFSRYSDVKIHEILQDHQDLLQIPDKYRGSVYDYLRRRATEHIRDRMREIGTNCKRMAQLFKVARWEADYHLLIGAKIIGMTTTGMSKYRPLVKTLKPKIVLVEEAAETLEPSITAAFLPSVEQVILVGDHQQLRGHCNLKELEGSPMHLDISMFERLVMNNIEFTQLNLQRRMRPEIREVLAPIYPALQDHPSVHGRGDIRGMGGANAAWIHHDFVESNDDQLSKVNKGEGLMVVMFAKYLVENGIAPSKITILTFYNGQRKLLGKLMSRHGTPDCRIATVDSFQGEENDVVILSLTRNNENHQIGFLSVVNRVCVALSRARLGFYVFGHITDVYTRSPLWRDVCKIMEGKTSLFSALRIVCQNHKNILWIENGEELQDLSGGCDQPCGAKMPCGHDCKLKCHSIEHDKLPCNQPCTAKLVCGHPCQNPCWNKHHLCGPCAAKERQSAMKANDERFNELMASQHAPRADKGPEQVGDIIVGSSVKTSPRKGHASLNNGAQAFQDFAAKGSPAGTIDNSAKYQAHLEDAAIMLAMERAAAAGSAAAAIPTLTADLAQVSLQPARNETSPRKKITERWLDPALKNRVREILEAAATKERIRKPDMPLVDLD